MTKKLARWLGIVAIAPLVIALSACGSKDQTSPAAPVNDLSSLPPVAATVNGKAIPTTAVVSQAFANAGYDALGHLIDYRLLDEAAAEQHIVVQPSDIKAGEQGVINALGAQSFFQQLTNHDISMQLVDDKIRHQIILNKLVEKQLPGPELMLHCRVLLVSTNPVQHGVAILKARTQSQALAVVARIQAQLRAGASFESLARQFSDDPFSAGKGGDLEIIDKSSDPSGGAIWTVAQGLKAGQLAPKPAQSYRGYDLVQIVSWSTSPLPSDSKSYAVAEAQYRAAMQQQLEQAEMLKLRGAAKIQDTLY